jgi:hypothetical protein
MSRALIAIGIGAVILVASAVGSTRSAHLSIVSTSPVSVQGIGFKASEHVTVTISSKTSRTKRLTASHRGRFTTMFRGFSIARCAPYAVRAKGDKGSSAFLKVVPECAPQRTTTTDDLMPTDPIPKGRGH